VSLRAANIVPIVLILILGAPTIALSEDEFAINRGITCWPDAEEISFAQDLTNGVLELTTGNANITADGNANFTGPIEIRSADRKLSADRAAFDREKNVFTVDGGVEYQDPQNTVRGQSARYVASTGEFYFADAEFELSGAPARGSANSIQITDEGIFKLRRANYTSCPNGHNDWTIKAKSIEIDPGKGMGTARGARIDFKGIPFLYLPYFTYPITDDRKSGLLLPKIGSSDSRGFEVIQPIYWNIAANYDATFMPRYMSKRGVQMGAEFRYLTRNMIGDLYGDYLPSDKTNGLDRWRYEINNVTQLPMAWRSSLKMVGVSDDDYFEDMSSARSETSQTNLERSWALEYYDRVWSIQATFNDYQTIDPEIVNDDKPYRQVPNLAADAVIRNGWLGLDYELNTEAAYFTRDDSVDGLRVYAEPRLSLPMHYRGLYITPEVALDFTTYKLQNEAPGENSSPSRTAPIVSINTGGVFDRIAGKDDRWIMTLEPRAQYTYIPFRDQTDIPVFDTILADFNLIQLYRQNRFIGHDRLGDTSQLSLGITSRLLESETGQEKLTATIGQSQFFDNGKVTLPDEIASNNDSSDYIAELGVSIWQNWNIDLRYQFDTGVNATAKSSVRFQYSPGESKAINVAYRYARESLEQVDFSTSWPLGKQWNAIGRYNYSLFEDKVLDRFVGLEYESCCWGIRLLARSSVSRTTARSESSISFQFLLKGFTSLGSGGASQLERDILGYNRY
jgi:LPS-assembly protein